MGQPYAFRYFGLPAVNLEHRPELQPIVQQAQQLEEWVRAEIYRQKLNNTTESFDWLMTTKMNELGLTEHMNKFSILEKIVGRITASARKDNDRDKLKRVQEQLIAQAERSKMHSRSIYKARETKYQEQLQQAYRTINQQKRSLAKQVTPTKGRK